jgi:microcompartment protein CcmK/EutM
MRPARILGRVFSTRQVPTLEGKRLLLIQPVSWEDGKERGDPIVAADACGSGSSEFVYWVAARDAAFAFPDQPPVDASVVGIIEGHQAGDFREHVHR